MKKVTMQMIADEMKISKSLVSLALNDRYGVSPEMRFDIIKCAVRMGYDFDYNYKSKNKKSDRKILAFISEFNLLTSPYWSVLFSGSEKLLSEENYILSIISFNDSLSSKELLDKKVLSQSAGALVIDDIPKEIEDLLNAYNIPICYVDGKRYLDGTYDSIRTNNYLGGYLSAEYLVEMGHKRIAFVGEKEYSISFRERYYGFRNVLDESKNVEFMGTIKQSTFDISSEQIEESNVIKAFKKEERPTALFCANDHIAIFTIEELKKIGLEAYKDYSIVGFDNLPEAEKTTPKLSSISVPIDEIGKEAVQQLLYRIRHKDAPRQTKLLSVKLIKRDSVKRMRKTCSN